jgi:VWA domain-containing protein
MTFLTPLAALAALAAILPVAAVVAGEMRVAAVRRALGLRAPTRRSGLLQLGFAAASVVLLGLAASQPTLASTSGRDVRTDVEALFVLDTSRSMAASATPRSPTRLDRAKAAAERLRAAIPEVAAGIATLTDRVLPDLPPVPDAGGFDGVLQQAVSIDSPPPAETMTRATTYGPLGFVPAGNYFDLRARRRIVVLLTDGESNPVDAGMIGRALSAKRGYRLLAVRVWRSGEAVYRSNGVAQPAYRPDPGGRAILAAVAAAAGGRSFEEDQVGTASTYLRRLAGHGPTRQVPGTEPRRTALAPYVAVAAILLFLASLWRREGILRKRPRTCPIGK